MFEIPADLTYFSPSVHRLHKHDPIKRTTNPLMDITNMNKTPKKTTTPAHLKTHARKLQSPIIRNQTPPLMEDLFVIQDTEKSHKVSQCELSLEVEKSTSSKSESKSSNPPRDINCTSSSNTPISHHSISLAGSSPPRHPQPILESSSESVHVRSTPKFRDAFLLRSLFSHLRLFGADSLLNLFIGWTFFHTVNYSNNKRIIALSLVPSMESNALDLLLLQTWRTIVAIMLTNLVASSNSHPLSLALVDAWNFSLLFIDYGPAVVFTFGWLKQQYSFLAHNLPKNKEPKEDWSFLEYLDSWMFLIHHVLFCKPMIVTRLVGYLILLSVNPAVLGIPYVEINTDLFQPNQLNLLRV